jgi:hypothetical protein
LGTQGTYIENPLGAKKTNFKKCPLPPSPTQNLKEKKESKHF